MSSVPQNKVELLSAINEAFRKLHCDVVTIPAELTRLCEIEGNVKGTRISVCDTLAYLLGWGRLVMFWYEEKAAGRDVEFPADGYKWNQLGLLAQHFQHEYRDWSFLALQQELQVTTASIVTLIDSLDNSCLYEQPWYEKWTLGRMIQFNTSSPMKNVRTKIRKFKNVHQLS
ncbi:ClbS/DfsB family four-helix bundle protein [Photobacterium sanguinicancri]|uniref:ClbS/DfsB family four-helix bundle protein n=1 Tax=Photobacterium sanguinicancri TaxID=875932 RepID=UPI002481431B|nr:ClbS/DfsB family four-helix bundle protein [Photobacterium sanguinicancri]